MLKLKNWKRMKPTEDDECKKDEKEDKDNAEAKLTNLLKAQRQI